MPTITIANPKGGAGKTTVATAIARGLEAYGDRVLLVDADPQGTARDWHAAAADNPTAVVGMDRAGTLRTLASMASDYRWVVIDSAGRLEDVQAEAIRAADLVVIPVQPSPYDAWALSDLIDLVQARQRVTDGRPVLGAIITRAVAGTVLDREIVDALGALGVDVMDTRLHQRQQHPRAANDGRTALESEPRGAAAEEIRAMVREVRALFEEENDGD